MTNINLYGPPNTLNFVEATRYFISRWDLVLNVTEFTDPSAEPTNVFQDDCLKVVPILVIGEEDAANYAQREQGEAKLQTQAQLSQQAEHSRKFYGHTGKVASHFTYPSLNKHVSSSMQVQLKQDHSRSEDPECPTHTAETFQLAPLRKRTKDTAPLNAVVCYACHAADVPGKFDAKMADSLGVPVKSRSVLVKGDSLTLANGKIVKPSDCISPATPGRIMLIVHCQNESIEKALVQHPGFRTYQTGGKYEDQVALMIHMTPSAQFSSPAYQQWMQSFNSAVQHVVVNADHCPRPIVFNSSAANQLRLNSLHPYIFPVVAETREASRPLPEAENLKLVSALPLLKFHLSPITAVGLDYSEVSAPLTLEKAMAPFTNPQQDKHQSFPENRAKLEKALLAHQQRLESTFGNAVPPDPLDVIFLGTGAAIPSKYRNVSSTYLHVRGFGGILLDAGEGSFGQLCRHFKNQEIVNSVIRNLKCIFVSHMHADHHLGVNRIILKYTELQPDPAQSLLIIAPPHYHNWITEYGQVEKLNYTLYNAYELAYPVRSNAMSGVSARDEILLKLSTLLGIEEAFMVPVIHCPDAFGLTLKHKDGWKVVFSGDTRPCALLDQAGMDCDLLIHEATFEDQLTGEAIEKNHATTTEAIQSAVNMKAKFLMMTHFSQRYPKIPVFDQRYGPTTGVAFDLMSIRFSDFPILPLFLDCLKDLFDEEDENDESIVDEVAANAPPAKKQKKKDGGK